MAEVENSKSCVPSQELSDFIAGGNFIHIAAAFVVGLALDRFVTKFVSSWVSPIIGIFGGRSFADPTLTINGSKFYYGLFFDALISFSKLLKPIVFELDRIPQS